MHLIKNIIFINNNKITLIILHARGALVKHRLENMEIVASFQSLFKEAIVRTRISD